MLRAQVEVEPGMGALEVDPYRLRQVLSNLVSNALNQMQDGGRLEVSAHLDQNAVRIEVADTGPGIPPDRLEQVFERFVKSGDSTGSGLGLSIARDLVEAHGGTIAAANRPQGGAVFSIALPVLRLAATIPQQTAMIIETGAQRARLRRDTRFKMAPRANNPANTHIPIGPTLRTQLEIGHPTRFEDEECG